MYLENEKNVLEEARPSSSKNEPSNLELAYLQELLSKGKRHYVCNEPRIALEVFVELCEKVADIYGQTGDECAEPYLYYAKTLLEMARVENGVLGNAVKDAPVLGDTEDASAEGDHGEEVDNLNIEEDNEDITSEKRAELRANVEHALREGNLYNDALTDEEEEGNDCQEDLEGNPKESFEVCEQRKNEENEDEEENVENEVTKETSDCEAVDDEEITNMQLSWEMFELCCIICNRMMTYGEEKKVNEAKSFLAEAKYGLAQISLESERYEESVIDFQACLELYKNILTDREDRKIAEVYYNIGLALLFDKKFAEAITNFEQAVSVLEARVKMLENKVNELEKNGDKDKIDEYKKEITELKDLVLLDMMAKIEDAQEMKKQGDASVDAVKKFAKEMFSGISNGFEEGFDQGFDKEFNNTATSKDVVNDIGFKVRSIKRKSEDEFPPSEAKKFKPSNDASTDEL
ncbi:protein HGV2 isoform X2 [Hydra vulgaris]|uniref:Protein HGV2 isoform X2 n=1 Tax=Hydra vulgaris TaxID=6087 RepID=A0ABM4C6N5_HYDVU